MKKGVSPVISTILLISLVILIALIILLWYQGFFKEKLLKFDKPIERVCEEISIRAFEENGNIGFTNIGNTPLYKIDVILGSQGSSQIQELDKRINPGDSINLEYQGDEIEIIPILLGRTKSGDKKEFKCETSIKLK